MFYNAKPPEKIKNSLPKSMPEVHRNQYMKGVYEVINLKQAGISKPLIENIKNYNHQLLKRYLYP